MNRLIQILTIYNFLVNSILADSFCSYPNRVFICNHSRSQGTKVVVSFETVPVQEKNVSCSCFIFAQSDIELVFLDNINPSIINYIKINNLSLEKASKRILILIPNDSMKLQLDGNPLSTSPDNCVYLFSDPRTVNIEVVCLNNNNKSVPQPGFTNTTTSSTYLTMMATETTTTSTEATSTRAAETKKEDIEKADIIYAIVGLSVGTGLLFVAIGIEVFLVINRRRRSSANTNKKPTMSDRSPNIKDNDDTYNVENALYISADIDNQPADNLTR